MRSMSSDVSTHFPLASVNAMLILVFSTDSTQVGPSTLHLLLIMPIKHKHTTELCKTLYYSSYTILHLSYPFYATSYQSILRQILPTIYRISQLNPLLVFCSYPVHPTPSYPVS
ncbi:hypothetical protein BDN72DRAFT_849425 [Pluteus cervinus]|uniref:Uncharacterized protein n=1 Tax=Pluteus cervinus TaxID=181527 RepID=A0ACD3A8T0_9AGAR|nr:hypothetical protein BDN72DRAFT_849425 [Pluteus cervinus]